jgi:hypothetical protein
MIWIGGPSDFFAGAFGRRLAGANRSEQEVSDGHRRQPATNGAAVSGWDTMFVTADDGNEH